jgi:hypothetical protein
LTENNFQTVEDVETEEKAAKEYLERLQRHRISLVFFVATKQLIPAEITVKLATIFGLLDSLQDTIKEDSFSSKTVDS